MVPTPKIPVTNDYHDTAIIDDYQWLEQAGTLQVKAWTQAENERTRSYFDRLPYRNGIAQQLVADVTQIRAQKCLDLRARPLKMLVFFGSEPCLQGREPPEIVGQTRIEEGAGVIAQAVDGDDNGHVRRDQSQQGIGRRRGRRISAKRGGTS